MSLGNELSPEAVRLLTGPGISDAGDILRAKAIRKVGPGHYHFILGEGKNREILLREFSLRSLRIIPLEKEEPKPILIGENAQKSEK